MPFANALCGGLLSASLPLFPPTKRAGCSQAASGNEASSKWSIHGVYMVFFMVVRPVGTIPFRAQFWAFGGCMRQARTGVRAEGASGTPAGSCGQRGDQTKMHGGDMSCLRVFFNRLAGMSHVAPAPVAIAPGLPERHVRLCLRRRVAAHRATRTAAQEPRQRHPETRPPAKAGDAFGPVFTTGWGVLAPRPEGPHHLARPMLVDPEQRIGCPAAQRPFFSRGQVGRPPQSRQKMSAQWRRYIPCEWSIPS